MKKLLTILGSIMISTSGAALVIACKTPSTKQPTNSDKNPSNNGDSSNPSGSGENKKPENTKPGESDSNNSTIPVDPKKPDQPDTPKPKPGEKEKDETKPNETNPITPVQPKPTTVIWNSIFRDSPTGADINLNPTKEQIEKEEKRLEELVKNILKDNNKINDQAFNKFVKDHKDWWNKFSKDLKIQIYRDSISGLDINLNPTKQDLEKEEKRLEEWVKEYLDKNKRENQALFDYLIRTKIDEIFSDSPTGLDIKIHYDKDSVKRAEKILDEWVKIYLEKVEKYNKNLFKKHIQSIWDNRVYNYSPTGADINFYLTQEQIDAENKKQEEIINNELQKAKERNIRIHKEGITKLKKAIDEFNLAKAKIENETNKKEKDLISTAEKTITEAKNTLETTKESTNKKLKEIEIKINKFEKDLVDKNIEDEINKSKEAIEDINELLKDSRTLAKEYSEKEKEIDKEVETAKKLETRKNNLETYISQRQGLIESSSNFEKLIQETNTKHEETIKPNKKKLEGIKAKQKMLESIKEDVNDEKNWSYEFYYNFDKTNPFRHNVFSKITTELENSKKEEEELTKLVKQLEEQKQKLINDLVIKKITAKQVKDRLPSLMTELDSITKEKQMLDKHLTEVNPQIVEIKKELESSKRDIENLEKGLQDANKIKDGLIKKLSDAKREITQLESQKVQLEKSLFELEAKTKETIDQTIEDLDQDIQDLDWEVYDDEKKIDDEITKLEKAISQIQEFIKEIEKFY
ncbi:MAG6090-like repeat-containing lipoprotein [Mycoplasma mycoides]|uniref:Lipoprotein n=1 Tax=Mycoplasma mycoides subsp. capri TaxID=40477 RepID=A0AB38GE25_MYCMC|nr:lipoprotein [Mycoplasma mycoides]ADH22197.1 putative liporotein [synthetic Mycoplasma mycoides JCVI-syn1.0]ACU78252.1 putative liporotein [Mycoplasma mycoides subsp. capri str. GM12]ACU79082.1 putative liporotein [Mycoplasma mycoides subsp. capri str. GM12]SRX58340.1 lipoprotein [Mycoplasma mycoides subsp. capri]SRX60874.1 lipoprotein [Mycoplasma mycoides subsp. capri]